MEWTWSFTVASVMDRARAICRVRHAVGYQGGDLAFAGGQRSEQGRGAGAPADDGDHGSAAFW
jgi:hypothetical protein